MSLCLAQSQLLLVTLDEMELDKFFFFNRRLFTKYLYKYIWYFGTVTVRMAIRVWYGVVYYTK